MIGFLPRFLTVEGEQLEIYTDYRVVLFVFQAFNDPNLKPYEKWQVCVDILFKNPEKINSENINEALEQANWFLNAGKPEGRPEKRVMDWEQDEQMIFSAINKVANKEVREVEYMHWWTFLGFFAEIEEGMLTTVIEIRRKKNKGKKLEKHEQELYNKHVDLIKLKDKISDEEEDYKNELLSKIR